MNLPGFDTSDFRFFAVRLDPHETRLPIDRSAETLLPPSGGASRPSGATRPAYRPSSAKVTPPRRVPPAVEVLLAGAEGATFLALVSRG
jgi:hypothetical protein